MEAQGNCRTSGKERAKDTEAQTQESQGIRHLDPVQGLLRGPSTAHVPPKGGGSSIFSAPTFKGTSEVLR